MAIYFFMRVPLSSPRLSTISDGQNTTSRALSGSGLDQKHYVLLGMPGVCELGVSSRVVGGIRCEPIYCGG